MRSTYEDTAWMPCPYCDHLDYHLMRLPNLAPPTLVQRAEDQDEVVSRTANGSISVHYLPENRYDRDDERDFQMVRTCTSPSCGRSWGVL